MNGFAVHVPDRRLLAGKSVAVDVELEPDRFRSVRLELAILEVKKMRNQILEAGSIPPRIVSEVAVPHGAERVELDVPADLPASYDGSTIGWSYELRLTGDRFGPDDTVTIPVEVVPLRDADARDFHGRSRGSLGDSRSSRPLTTSGQVRAPGPEKGSLLSIGLVLSIVAAVDGDTVRVTAPSTQLDSYPGNEVAVHWLLQLGLTSSKAGRGGVALDIVPQPNR